MSEFDLERFKAGEPAFAKIGTYYYIGVQKDGSIVAENDRGHLMSFFSNENSDVQKALTMKPVTKKVDLSRLPVDTLVKVGSQERHRYFHSVEDKYLYFFRDGCTSKTSNVIDRSFVSMVSIHDKQPWTLWQGGDIPPIPDGLEFEVIFRDSDIMILSGDVASTFRWKHISSGSDFISYRLTGKVLEGWEL